MFRAIDIPGANLAQIPRSGCRPPGRRFHQASVQWDGPDPIGSTKKPSRISKFALLRSSFFRAQSKRTSRFFIRYLQDVDGSDLRQMSHSTQNRLFRQPITPELSAYYVFPWRPLNMVGCLEIFSVDHLRFRPGDASPRRDCLPELRAEGDSGYP